MSSNLHTKTLEGILLIDKPEGCTSHDVVDRVRRKLRMKRIGHAGTLDPLATGLLIILVGKATKASSYLMSLNKTYEGTLKFGEATDSHDSDGKILEVKEVPSTLTSESLEAEMHSFLGDQYQTPPMFSAKKVNGVPLYKLARKGKTIAREPRLIHVFSFKLQSEESKAPAFELKCSKGTYVRTIVHDLGQNVGCGAHLTQLRRTATEHFDVRDAVDLKSFEAMEIGEIKKALVPLYEAVPSSVL